MAKNVKPEYLRKLLAIDKNGYKFDIANYLYNPAYGYEYPRFKKKIAEDELTETYRCFLLLQVLRRNRRIHGGGIYRVQGKRLEDLPKSA